MNDKPPLIFIGLIIVWLGGCGAGIELGLQIEKRKHPTPNWVERSFEAGQNFSDGWNSCFQAYGIYWDSTNLCWACSISPRLSTNNGYILHELIIPRRQ